MNTLLKALKEQYETVTENYDVNLAVNEFAAVYNKLEVSDTVIEYTAECVPVFKMDINGNERYCVEMDNLNKLMKSQNINEAEALDSIFNSLKDEGEDVAGKYQMSVIIPDENMEHIMKEIKKDATTMPAKCEQVVKYTNKIKAIMNEGVNICIM